MIVVFGSINVDLVARVARLPRPGETLAAHGDLAMLAGGKGANQALAAARAGASVRMFGCVGRDAIAPVALAGLRAAGVDLAGVLETDASTGTALIHVDDAGENCITIVAGANALARADAVPDTVLTSASTVLMQLEVPIAEVAALTRRAHERGARVILNAAPALPLAPDFARDVDVLVVNEAEARMLASRIARVVITCGERGAIFGVAGELHRQAALSVDIVDTVGAGDAFAGALAAALDRGNTFADAVRDGVAAGTLSCTRAGAQAAMPSRAAIAQCVERLPRPMPYA